MKTITLSDEDYQEIIGCLSHFLNASYPYSDISTSSGIRIAIIIKKAITNQGKAKEILSKKGGI